MPASRAAGAAKLVEGLRWRYRSYLEPHVIVHRNPAVYVRRCFRNSRARQSDAPVAYVCANPSNAGDYASQLGVRHLSALPGVEMFCDPAGTAVTLRGLRAGPRPGVKWAAVFIGGGGVLQECFDPFWRGIADIDVPLVLFGVGANEAWPNRRATDAALLARIAGKAAAMHVRDEFTRRLLVEHTETPVTVGICPSVNYVADRATTLIAKPTHLLHAVHDVDLRFAGIDPDDLRERLRASAVEMGLKYDEVDHMSGVDRPLLRRYARAALVVSSRLHGAIFAYAMRKPCVAIECDQKMGGFLDTHAPRTPSVHGRNLKSAMQSDALARVIDAFTPYDYQPGLAANRARMREIAASLELRP